MKQTQKDSRLLLIKKIIKMETIKADKLNEFLSKSSTPQFTKHMAQEGLKILLLHTEQLKPQMRKLLLDYDLIEIDKKPIDMDVIDILLSILDIELVNQPSFLFNSDNNVSYIDDGNSILAHTSTYSFGNLSELKEFIKSNISNKIYLYHKVISDGYIKLRMYVLLK